MKKSQIIILITAVISMSMFVSAIYYTINQRAENNNQESNITSDYVTILATTEIQTTTTHTSAETFSATATTKRSDQYNISAPYAGLYNVSTGESIYEKNVDTQIHPASLTKVLTAITALTYMDTETILTVGSEQKLLPKHSSICLIKEGHRLTLYDLLTGMLVASGNDAAYTIAVNVSRLVTNNSNLADKEAISYFTNLMNYTAKAIGVKNSYFTTPDGFDNENQYTCISDLALISRYALEFEEIREITSITQKKVYFKSGENVVWSNSNKLLHSESPFYFSKSRGMKTGTTTLAGKCLIATAEINSQTYIAIVAGCESDEQRYNSSLKLFDIASTI